MKYRNPRLERVSRKYILSKNEIVSGCKTPIFYLLRIRKMSVLGAIKRVRMDPSSW
jgi:hypothetical protein